MNLKAKMLYIIMGSVVLSLQGADTVIDWTQYGGTYSGSFTDVNRWNPQTYGYPGSLAPDAEGSVAYQVARFNQIGEDFTVGFPAETTTSTANFLFYGASGRVAEFAGLTSIWNIPPTTVANYNFSPFQIFAGDKANPLVQADAQWGSINSERVGAFTNFMFRVSNTNAVHRFDLLAGNIYLGVRRIMFFNGSTSSENLLVKFHDGVNFTSSNPVIGAAGPENLLEFDGGTQTFSGGLSFTGANASKHVTLRIADNAYCKLGGSISASASPTAIEVLGGATLYGNVSDLSTGAGSFRMLASGAGSKIQLRHIHLANGIDKNAFISVTDDAQFAPSGAINLGGQSTGTVAGSFGGLYITNATVVASVNVYSGEIVLGEGGVIKLTADTSAVAGKNVGGVTTLIADGGGFDFGWGVTCPGKDILNGFTSAKVGAKGLVIDPPSGNYKSPDFIISQNFLDADDAQGEGRIVVAGSKVNAVTFTGKSSQESELVSAGTAIVKLAGEAMHYSHVIVTNNAAFSVQGATQTGAIFKALTLGNANSTGTLMLDADEPVTVDGAIELIAAKLAFSSTLAYGTNTVFESSAGTQNAGAVERWNFKIGVTVIQGLPAGAYVKFQCVEQDGKLLFQIKIAAEHPSLEGDTTWSGPETTWATSSNWSGSVKPTANLRAVFAGANPLTVTLPADAEAAAVQFAAGGYTLSGGRLEISDNDSASIESPAGANEIVSELVLNALTECMVAAGSSLSLSSRVFGNGVVKKGAGALLLSGVGNALSHGIEIREGTLGFAGSEPIAVDAQLAINVSASPSNAVVLKADAPATIALGNATQGSIYKRGSAPLVLETLTDVTLGLKAWKADDVLTTDYVFVNSAAVPEWPHGPINVAEGALVFRGTGTSVPKVTLSAPASDNRSHSFVGMRLAVASSETPSEPGLVVDHANLASPTRELYLGAGLSAATTYARAPYVTLTNGAVLTIRNFIVGSGSMTKDIHPEFTADASTLSINQLYPNASLITAATNVFKFVNGSSLFQSAAMNIQGSVRFLFDHSGFYGNNSNQVRTVNIGVGSFGETSGFIADFTFSNGSRFNCDSLSYTAAASSTKAPFILTFEDSEWYAGAGTVTLPTTNLNVSVQTVAGGIVFAPPSGAVWKFVSPISGAGGLVKAGAGTLLFDRQFKYHAYVVGDPETLRYTGATDVREGTLAITEGAISRPYAEFHTGYSGALDLLDGSLVSPVLSGAGTFRGGTLVTPMIKVSVTEEGEVAEIPTLDFANGLATEGLVTIDFGRTAENPLVVAKTGLTVARWTGTAKPDLSNWESAGTGVPDSKCQFLAEDDSTITAIPGRKGLMIIIR
ncbi:MAG: hypothetical protein WC340_12495 [Kiritimatiellia bacterium]